MADSTQSLANADAQALVTASGGKITWAQLVALTATALNQSGGQDEVQQGTNPATNTPYAVGQPNAGFGPWQVTPWTTGNGTPSGLTNPPTKEAVDGTPNLQNAALAAWSTFQSQGFGGNNGQGGWFLNQYGTGVGADAPAEVQNNPGGYVPNQLAFQQAISAANTVMQPPTNYSTPANAAVVAAAGGPNTLNPDTVPNPNIMTPSGPGSGTGTGGPPTSTGATGSIMGNCNKNTNYINFPSVLGFGGGGILNQCQVKTFLSFLLIVSGSLLGLAGVLLVFDRSGKLMGKAGGKAAELAGAGLAAVPGGEVVGATVMATGHKVSKTAGASKPAPRQRSTVSRADHEQDIYAQGVAAGQPRSQPVRPRQNSGPGSRYQDMSGAF